MFEMYLLTKSPQGNLSKPELFQVVAQMCFNSVSTDQNTVNEDESVKHL